jgi:hypothetical protein
MQAKKPSRYYKSSGYLLRRMVMQENRERVLALVGLAFEPYRQRILHLHKKH